MTAKNKYTRLIADTAVFGIGNFLVKLIQYLLLPVYTASMTTEAYGTGELLNNLSEFMLPIVTLALYEALFRFAVDSNQDKDAMLYESCLLLLKLFAGLWLLAFVIQHFISYDYTWYLMFVLTAYSIRMIFANFARGCGLTKCFAMSGLVNAIALVFFSGLLVAYLRVGVVGYLIAMGMGHTCSALFLLFGAKILQRLLLRKRDQQILHTMLRYSLPLIFNNIAWWLTSMSSRYIVLFAYGAAMAGLYTAANKLPAVISMVSQVFQQAWQLNSAREIENNGRETYCSNVLRYYCVLIFLCSSAAICITPLLAALTLKNEFIEAQYFIPAMMLAVGTHCISAYFGSLLLALKKSDFAMHGMLIGAVINIILALLSIKSLGVWGVLIASLVCYLAILCHRIHMVSRYMKIDKNLQLNIPLYAVLCVQTGLMSFGNTVCTLISVILLIFMLVACIIYFKSDIMRLIEQLKLKL